LPITTAQKLLAINVDVLFMVQRDGAEKLVRGSNKNIGGEKRPSVGQPLSEGKQGHKKH
jgi:hypothetical protein